MDSCKCLQESWAQTWSAGAELDAGLWAGAHIFWDAEPEINLQQGTGAIPGTGNFLQLLQQNLPQLICRALNL